MKTRAKNIHIEELRRTLAPIGISGRVLDVGSRGGSKLPLLRELGAKALVGCDPAPNTEQLNDNLRKAEMRKSDFFQCKVEEMPEELKGSFDSAVIFNVSVPYYERLDFFKAIREMVNTDGKMILAIAEHDLVNDYWKVVNEAGFRVIQKKNLVRLIYINDQLSIDTFTDSQKMNYPDSTILIAAPTPSQ